MAGPHPVVGVGAEFTYRGWRSSHKADIGEHLVAYQIVCVAAKERHDRGFYTRAFRLQGGGQFFFQLIQGLSKGTLVNAVFGGFLYLRRNVLETLQERHGETFYRELFCKGHCPVALSQIVVVYTAEALD